MTDKKIEEYLDRAEKILRAKLPHGDNYGELIVGTVEIAKMIQLEEHREQYPRIEQTEDGLLTVFRNSVEKSKNENWS